MADKKAHQKDTIRANTDAPATSLMAVLSEVHFLLHGRLRSGNCGTSRGVEEFVKEALALWGRCDKIRFRLLRRQPAELFGVALAALYYADQVTPWVKRAAKRAGAMDPRLDTDYAVG